VCVYNLHDALVCGGTLMRKLRPAIVHELHVARQRRVHMMCLETRAPWWGLLCLVCLLCHLVRERESARARERERE
jgi:hypothetical protein